MIPVRVHTDTPISTTGGIRPPMSPDHPLAGTPCPVCDGPLTDQPIVFVVVGIHPDDRKPQGGWTTGAAVVVHAICSSNTLDEQGMESDLARFDTKGGE